MKTQSQFDAARDAMSRKEYIEDRHGFLVGWAAAIGYVRRHGLPVSAKTKRIIEDRRAARSAARQISTEALG